jgi:hypothetical protein
MLPLSLALLPLPVQRERAGPHVLLVRSSSRCLTRGRARQASVATPTSPANRSRGAGALRSQRDQLARLRPRWTPRGSVTRADPRQHQPNGGRPPTRSRERHLPRSEAGSGDRPRSCSSRRGACHGPGLSMRAGCRSSSQAEVITRAHRRRIASCARPRPTSASPAMSLAHVPLGWTQLSWI